MCERIFKINAYNFLRIFLKFMNDHFQVQVGDGEGEIEENQQGNLKSNFFDLENR